MGQCQYFGVVWHWQCFDVCLGFDIGGRLVSGVIVLFLSLFS